MSRDKIEGFLIGLGAGVLFGSFVKLREEPGKHAADGQEDAAEALAAAREHIPPDTIAHLTGLDIVLKGERFGTE